MHGKVISDEDFIALWRQHKSPAKMEQATGITLRAVNLRRRAIELRYKIQLEAEDTRGKKFEYLQTAHRHSARFHLGIESGVVLVFSDAHFWPGIRTTAFKGLIHMIRSLKPKAVICAGDAFDGAGISRWPRIGWDKKPTVIEELRACQAAMEEIEEEAKAARHNVKLAWTLGNHDARFENFLAHNAPQFEGVNGFTLKEHFPAWEPCWSCWLSEEVVVKHRFKGGVHATHNNAVNAGRTIVTGHLHSLKVTPFSDYNHRPRWGVDTGTLADPTGDQFVDYQEDNPVNHRSGFAVLTFNNGHLLWPELVHKFSENLIEFRGEVIDVEGL